MQKNEKYATKARMKVRRIIRVVAMISDIRRMLQEQDKYQVPSTVHEMSTKLIRRELTQFSYLLPETIENRIVS